MKKRIVANPFNMILSGAFLLGMAAYCAFMGGGAFVHYRLHFALVRH